MGPVNCPFYFYSIFLFYLLQILACFLLFLLHLFLRLFPKFFFLLFFLSSIISNFFPFSPSILYQISCYSIYITFLLYIFLAVLLYSLLCYSFFFICLTLPPYSSSNLSTKFCTFPKFSLGSQMSFSVVYFFHHTRYLFFSLNFLLFNIFSTLYSSSPLIITGDSHFFLWPST